MNETEIKEKLKAFICQKLIGNPDYPLTNDEPLITGGLIDSFSLVRIAVFVEDAFKVYIPDIDLTVVNLDTIDAMTGLIMKGME